MPHTPGPWSQGGGRFIVREETGLQVAQVSLVFRIDQNLDTEMMSANARLVAAAPELLEACKAVVEEDGFRGSALMRSRIDQMRAAIAKAEGHA